MRNQMNIRNMPSTIVRRTFSHSPFLALDEFMNLLGRETAADGCCDGKASASLAVDIRESKDEFVVEASLPGFKKGEVDVQVHDGLLSINASRETCTESKDETYLRRERSVTSLARQVRLPDGVDGTSVKAELVDGVLTLRIPKPAQLQPRKVDIA